MWQNYDRKTTKEELQIAEAGSHHQWHQGGVHQVAVAGLPPGLERVQQILHPQMWSCSTQQNLGHHSWALCEDVRILSGLFWSSIVCPLF